MDEPELHQLVRERRRGVPPGHRARQLTIHLVIHAEEDGHLKIKLNIFYKSNIKINLGKAEYKLAYRTKILK